LKPKKTVTVNLPGDRLEIPNFDGKLSGTLGALNLSAKYQEK
jgi:hypothetical protein